MSADEPLYTDEQGVPILFDVVVAGDRARALGVATPQPATTKAVVSSSPPDLEQRIRAAIEAALPKVTERTAAAMRDALLREVHDALRDDAPRPD